MQVIVFDPLQEAGRRAERTLAGVGFEVITAGSLNALASLVARAAPSDAVVARLAQGNDGSDIAEQLHTSRFRGRTFFIVDDGAQLGLENRLGLPQAESLPFSQSVMDTISAKLSTVKGVRGSGVRSSISFHGMVGRSKQILEVFGRAEKAAAGDANVCIYGESGTGKELVARAIHAISDRRNGPLITFDCTAVPEGLAESQLFGHVRGAFTGAVEHRDGVFSQADNGTLFIDELCELSMPLQAKLLRVVQGREFVKVGGTKPIRTNIRLVTATNKDPKKAVDSGAFRADLYYRVAVVMIKVPALRERRDDIPLLVDYFLQRFAAVYKKPIRGVQSSAMERMVAHPWPGNIRQLENFLAQAVVLAEGDILTERDLFLEELPSTAAPTAALQFEPGLPLREVERRHILRTLQRVQGNRTEAARLLGISVRCLQYKLKAYAQIIDKPSIADAPLALDADPRRTVQSQIAGL